MIVFERLSLVIHANPDHRSFVTPAPRNTIVVSSHTIRTGQRYSPLAGLALPRGSLRIHARTSASIDHPSPHLHSAITNIASTSTASPCPVLPKLFGSAIT